MGAGHGPRDLERTRANILEVATRHLARTGFHGARIDEIADETATTKRMIYYCFDSKAGLFFACLHEQYRRIRAYERSLNLGSLPPEVAVDTYVRATVRYHEENPQLARLVRTENILEARHLGVEDRVMSRPIIGTLDAVLDRGRAEGVFRDGVTGVELYVAVTAFSNYRITNQRTVQALFEYDLRDPDRLEHDLDQYSAMILGWLRRPAAENPAEPALG